MTKSKTRTKSTGEVFTPPELVDEIINKLYEADPSLFINKEKIFLDPTCGDGEFLRGVIRKLKKELKSKFTKARWEYAIQYQLLGVDLMWDNTCDAVYHLLRSWEVMRSQPKETNMLNAYKNDKNTTDDQGLTVTTVFKCGFELNENHTPDEINGAFISRSYKDRWGTVTIRPQKDSNHYVEYAVNGGEWIPVENIVRANSLVEWDFENWCPSVNKSKDPIRDLLEF